MARAKTKAVKYRVQCPFDEKHVFEKVFTIEEGSEGLESEVETFCARCDKMVTVTVEGKAFRSETLTRTLKRYNVE